MMRTELTTIRKPTSALFSVAALAVMIGWSNAQIIINPAYVRVNNKYLTLAVEPTTGRFHLYTAGGARAILAASTADVNGAFFRIDPPVDDPIGNVVQFGEGGEFVTDPVQSSQESIIAVWETTDGLDNETISTNSSIAIRVEQRLTLLRDALKVQYTVQNNGRFNHRIGTRILLQAEFPTSLTVTDSEIAVVPGHEPMRNQTIFPVSSVPGSFFAFDADPVTGQIASGAFRALGTLSGDNSVRPDELIFTDQTDVTTNPFDIPDNPFARIVNVVPVCVYNDVNYTPGQSRTFTVYFGLGDATSDYEPNPVVALESPREIALLQQDDPATTTIEEFYLDPQDIVVRAFVYNTSQLAIADTTATLILPEGLEFQTGEIASKKTGAIPAFSESTNLAWRVKVNGRVSGRLPLIVTTASSGASAKSVTRYIDVPPLPQDFTTNGLRMVTFPYTFDDPDPAVAVIDRTTSSTLRPLNLATYDTDIADYLYYERNGETTGDISALEAGVGYWLKTNRETYLDFQGANLIPGTTDFLIPLARDWNMIGSPYTASVFLGRTRFFYQGQSYTWLDAVARGLIRSTVYTYDPNLGAYTSLSSESSELSPMVGYWMKALFSGMTVVFPADMNAGRSVSPPSGRAATPSSTAQQPAAPDWLLNIQASIPGARLKDTSTALGVGPQASSRYDPQDVEEPPPFSGFVNVSFPHRDWGKDSGYYRQDVRKPSSGKQVWDMDVASDQSLADCVLTWPNIQRVPRQYRVTLVDLDANRRVYMRTTEAYRYRTGDGGGIHHFRIEVSNDPSGVLRITGVAVSSAAGRSLSKSVTFNLSRAATVRCEVKNATGRTVRVIDPGTPRDTGMNLILWDQRGNLGQVLPRGVYLLEILATTEEQQSVRVVKTIRVQ